MHHSEDTPPNMPYFRESEPLQPKQKAGTSIAESVAAAVTATMAAIVTRKQEQLSTTNNVTVFTCINFSENSYASSKTTVEN